MLELICKRLLLAIPTLLLVSMMVFGLQKLLPGDPLIAMAGEERDPVVIAQLRALSDRDLADLAIDPSDLAGTAQRAVYGA